MSWTTIELDPTNDGLKCTHAVVGRNDNVWLFNSIAD